MVPPTGSTPAAAAAPVPVPAPAPAPAPALLSPSPPPTWLCSAGGLERGGGGDGSAVALHARGTQARQNYQKADALQKIIVDAGYRSVPNARGEEVLAKKYRIKLRGIDAPESAMPYGKEAKEALLKLVQGKSLKVYVYDEDRYGRCVGDIYCDGVFVQVRVANVDWIKIIAEEHISLMEGSTKDLQILAGTQDGQIFGDSQFKYLDIELHLGDEILELIGPSESMDGPNFSIKAAKIGITPLYVSTKQHSGQRVLSQVVKVEVYRPLQIHPEYIYLTPGASFVNRDGRFIDPVAW